jgi:bifunctional UDP-N-acetylglucosamine pyrophosphorylase / glucosamine-1-phosphate N-acetyltransferase
MSELHIVVLAAGKGTRMKSALPKVLHRVGGEPMIAHVLRVADPLRPSTITIVVGHMANAVKSALAWHPDVRFVVQEPQLGTGHALLQAESELRGRSGTLVLLSGDVPLLRPATLRRLVDAHRAAGAAATVVTADIANPFGYGRIVRSGGQMVSIVEERDATDAQRAIREINSGVYAFDLPPLFDALRGLATENTQGEYYLPDLVAVYRARGLPVEAVVVQDADEIRGINSRRDLAEVSAVVRQQKNDALMAAGVTIEDPATTYIGQDVEVGADTIIHPGVHLEGRTRVGGGCELHSGVRIVDSSLGDGVTVLNFCVILHSRISDGARIGPFAHLRPESDVGRDAHIGNFVELKKTTLGAGSKANHLAYLGDATIGERVNVGAGTITCNYDGEAKHQTTIEDGAFIGSDSQLVAPVRVGRGAYVAAGSSITQDVPAGALGIARGRQTNVEDWVARKKAVKKQIAGAMAKDPK